MRFRKLILTITFSIAMIYLSAITIQFEVCSSSGQRDLYDTNADEWKVVCENGLYYPVYKTEDIWYKVKYYYDEGTSGMAYDLDVGCHGYSQTVNYVNSWFAERYIDFVKLGVISPL